MDVGKREDRMMDYISTLKRNRDNTKAWLELYQEGNMISPEVASHLWEVLSGIEVPIDEVEAHDDNLVPSDQPQR